MYIQWKENVNKLLLIEESEIAITDNYELHVEKLKDFDMSKIMNSVYGTLSDKELDVLETRFDLDDRIEKRRRMKELKKEYCWNWRVCMKEEDMLPFNCLSGKAKSKEDAKRFAEHAIQFMNSIADSFSNFVLK